MFWFSADLIGLGCCCNHQIPRLSVAAGVVEALMLRLGPHAPLLCGNHSMQVEKPGNTLSHTCCLLGWRTTDSPCRTSCVARALSLCAATLATLAWQGWRSNIRDGPRGHMLHERLRSHETTGLAFRAVRATQPQAAKAYRLLLLPSPLGVGLATYSRHQSGRDNAPGADTTAL